MKKIKIQKIENRRLTVDESIKLARQIRRINRKTLNLPEDFDVLKFIHDMR